MGIEFFVVVIVAVLLWRRFRKRTFNKTQERFISSYTFPSRIKEKVKQKYPHLSDQQLSKVMRGLKEYFVVCGMARHRMVAMPSQIVDVAWHEFILFTRQYDDFCKKALGKFLHHTPTEAMKTRTLATEGIKRAWRLSCLRERLDPKQPSRLPLLFALDAELGIADGFRYSLNCKAANSPGGDSYCASHIGCSSGCGGDSGSGDSSSDSGGCSSGCGGGGD